MSLGSLSCMCGSVSGQAVPPSSGAFQVSRLSLPALVTEKKVIGQSHQGDGGAWGGGDTHTDSFLSTQLFQLQSAPPAGTMR